MFENLKDMLGEAYHDGITAEEVNTFFAGKKFADLSTGLYVDKNKYDRDIQALNTTISEKQNELSAKMTDDEKKIESEKQKDAEIQRLTKLLKENTLTTNKSVAENNTMAVKKLLDIKDDDADFNTFISNIVSEDNNKTSLISKYIETLANKAYDKGKKDATRDAMGDFGKGQGGSASNINKKEESLGTKLAKASNASIKDSVSVDYFKRD